MWVTPRKNDESRSHHTFRIKSEDLAVKYDLHLTGHVLSKGNKAMLELMLMLLASFLTQEMRTTAAKFAWVGGGRCCCVSGSKVMG